MARKITIDQFAEELKNLPGEVRQAAIRGCRSAALRGVGFAVEAIQSAKPHPAVNTGALVQSVRSAPIEGGGRISVDAPHAAIMEDGTRPFRPPLAPLVLWAKRRFQVSDKEAKSIAWAVREAIAKRGIAPRHFFAAAIDRTYAILGDEIEAELKKL